MSWIVDLAGKAENILNKLDTEAASVLTKPKPRSNSGINYKDSFQTDSHKSEHKRSSSYSFPTSSSVPGNLNDVEDIKSFREVESLNSSPKRIKNKKNWNHSKDHHDKSLLDFLNDSKEVPTTTIVTGTEGNANVNIIADNRGHSRQSSVSSGSSFLAVSGRNTPGFASLDIESSTGSGGSGSTDPYITLEAPLEAQLSPPSSQSSTCNDVGISEKNRSDIDKLHASSIQECGMLRKEVTSLNQEMAQVLRRAKEAEKESHRLKDQLSNISLQQRQSDALLRDMQEKECRLQESIRKKDGLLSSLQAKFQNIDQKISEREEANRELQEQNQRLLEGSTMSNSLHSEVVTSLQDKLRSTEESLLQERDLHDRLREESSQRITQLEEDQKTMLKDISEANKKFHEEKSKSDALKSQISTLKNELSSTKSELSDYKAKAGRILQSKDKLISSLKEGNNVSCADELLKEEMDQIRSERDLLQEELARCLERINHLGNEVVQTEVLAQQEAKTSMNQLAQVQEDLEREQSEKSLIQDELKQSKYELKCIQDDLTRQKVNLSTRLQERDAEIQRLQKQIAHKQSSSSSVSELEKRIHALTESLIVKQTTIESISTDKHTLQIQLEKLQEQYHESQSMLNKDSVIELNQEEVRNRGMPSFLMESPFDGGVTRRVKKAYGTLDKFSVRLGVFLRRYPISRVFILLYMGLLHVWVMVVLLTYKPEIHGADFIHPFHNGNGGIAPMGPDDKK